MMSKDSAAAMANANALGAGQEVSSFSILALVLMFKMCIYRKACMGNPICDSGCPFRCCISFTI